MITPSVSIPEAGPVVERTAFRLACVAGVLGVVFMVWTWSRAASMSADGAHYMELAERSWHQGPRTGMDWYAGPGYPVVVGWVYGLLGDLDFAGRLTSMSFALATLVMVASLGYRMFGGAVASLAVAILTVHTTFVRHAVMAETDAAYGFWLVCSILCTWELSRAAKAWQRAVWAVLCGLSLGVGYLTRPEAVPLAGLLGTWFLSRRRPKLRSDVQAPQPNRIGIYTSGLKPPLAPRTSEGRGQGERRGEECAASLPTSHFPATHHSLSCPSPGLWPPSPRKRGEGEYWHPSDLCGYQWPSNAAQVQTRIGSIGFGERVVWFLVVALVFLVLASPYLMRLRAEVGHWSLSGKERSIVLKFVPDKENYQDSLRMGVTRALLYKPSSLLHWLPYHLHWGVPQFGKSLNLIVLVLVPVGVSVSRCVPRARGAVPLLLWVSVPFIVFFFLTFPGRRYFMQAMPPWTILAAVGSIEVASGLARWRARIGTDGWAARRAFRIALATPVVLMVGSTLWGVRGPIELSLSTERKLGERIYQLGGPGRRVLGFTVTAFYARAHRVPLWGPMEGIVRCHGYGKPLSYDELRDYVREHRVEYIVMDQDLRADCPEFLEQVRPEEFELVSHDIVDHHGPHLIYRAIQPAREMRLDN